MTIKEICPGSLEQLSLLFWFSLPSLPTRLQPSAGPAELRANGAAQPPGHPRLGEPPGPVAPRPAAAAGPGPADTPRLSGPGGRGEHPGPGGAAPGIAHRGRASPRKGAPYCSPLYFAELFFLPSLPRAQGFRRSPSVGSRSSGPGPLRAASPRVVPPAPAPRAAPCPESRTFRKRYSRGGKKKKKKEKTTTTNVAFNFQPPAIPSPAAAQPSRARVPLKANPTLS